MLDLFELPNQLLDLGKLDLCTVRCRLKKKNLCGSTYSLIIYVSNTDLGTRYRVGSSDLDIAIELDPNSNEEGILLPP